MSIAFPTMEEPPFLLDMATSIVPYNRVLMMMEAGQPVPDGWGLDSDGKPTQDSSKLRQLFPLGGTRVTGGHKGFGLGLVVEVLCAILSGGWLDTTQMSNFTEFNLYKQHNDAHFFGAIRLDLFRHADEFKRDMDALVNHIHAAPTEAGKEHVYYPGEIEYLTRKKRDVEGIPVTDPVWSILRDLSEKYKVPI
jgi:LDH2 family malate/lactate/ureidoglycolate dehydrogenase